MDSTRHYSSIILSPSFTFLVGPRHTKLTIQSALAQHVSKPLHNLMNNGYTRESKHRIAVLEDEDVETFVAFCEYAYTGDYNVPQLPAPREEERTRTAIAETATSPAKSWREIHRSDSMSSAVPPPAPSPPPESVDSTSQTVKPQSEPEPVIEERPSAEAAAEEEEEAKEEEKPASEYQTATSGENDLYYEPQEPAELAQTEAEPAFEAIPQPEGNTEPVDEVEEPDSLVPATTKKAKKLAKRKKKNSSKPPTEETVVNLTPPSTPPPEASIEVNEAPAETSTLEEALEETSGSGQANLWEESTAQKPEEADSYPSYELNPEPELKLETVPEPEPEPELVPVPEPEQVGEAEPSVENDWAEPGDDSSSKQAPSQDQWAEEFDEAEGQEGPKEVPPKPFIDMSFARQSQSDSSPRTPGLSLWDEFAALQYNDEKQDLSLPTPSSSTSETPCLTFHAKVYVFATRYLIPALAQLCLRKLHRDLLSLSLEDTDTMNSLMDSQMFDNLAALQTSMVLDLLRYAYTKTARLEPISPTSATQLRENELRRLVAHYAACKVKELARYRLPGESEAAKPSVRPIDAKGHRVEAKPPKSLRALLDVTPELASDLVYRMVSI